MKAHILIGLLLGCTAAALPMDDDVDFDVEADLQSYGNTPNYIYDDDSNLIEVDMKDDDAETVEETKKDLANRVFFYIHGKKTLMDPQQLFVDDEESLKKSDFDPSKPTKIVTHGWMNSRRSPACVLIRDAYIKHGDYNVIVVDWSSITFRPYIWASKRVKMVGEYVAQFIDFLENNGADLHETTLVGHSLGAHVMGLAARNAKGMVNYVVGLDPALPGFGTAGPGFRISSGDASHVEIIHTNAGLLGFLAPIGDSDFYPNGGTKQLGCIIDVGGACSHARSYQFFAESINTQVGFYGRFCKSYFRFRKGRCNREPLLLMGGRKRELTAAGTFYLSTKSTFPFALGH